MRRTFGLLLQRSVAVAMLVLPSCTTDAGQPSPGDEDFERDPALDVDLVSEQGGQASHETGRNCMECHQANGVGPGRFTAAGTLYGAGATPLRPIVVEFISVVDGSVLIDVEVDALGNFYTTEPLPLPEAPVLPRMRTHEGAVVASMPFPTLSASCNLCHAGSARVELEG